MLRFAIQEMMLPGRGLAEKLEHAARLGFTGVEFDAGGLTERIPEVVDALAQTGMVAAAVHMGRRDGYLAPHLAEREAAISALRQAMADAVDIGAAHVVFVPHYGQTRMPDLTPYRAPVELEAEMMVWLLRTVSDLAYAMGVELDMLPLNRYETYFMNRLEQAALFRRKIKDHPHVKIAANCFHMALEEADLIAALKAHASHIGYFQVADHNCRLPGQGMINFAAVAAVLREAAYEGWVTYACEPGSGGQAARLMQDLPASVTYLRQAGF